MGVYNNVLITTTDLEERVSSITNYLNGLDGITAEADSIDVDEVTYNGTKFSFDGTQIEGFFGYNDALTTTVTYLKNGDIYLSPIGVNTSSSGIASTNIHSYVNNGCKLIAIDDVNTSRRGIEVILIETKGSAKLVGYKVLLSETDYFADISQLAFESISDSARIPYQYTNMFPYVADDGFIDFLAQAYFVNSNSIRQFETDKLRESSTVSVLSTASLQDGNYLAIGAHCLAPLDSEEVDE